MTEWETELDPIPQGMRRCHKCGEVKVLELAFELRPTGTRYWKCRPCRQEDKIPFAMRRKARENPNHVPTFYSAALEIFEDDELD